MHFWECMGRRGEGRKGGGEDGGGEDAFFRKGNFMAGEKPPIWSARQEKREGGREGARNLLT